MSSRGPRGSERLPDTPGVRQRVSASTQNQAWCALLFLSREVIGLDVESLSPGVRATTGSHLPVVLSVPEMAGLLDAMTGTARLMAAVIYGGGLRVSECCELRVEDVDFEQGLVVVRGGEGDKDRSTLLARAARDSLREQRKPHGPHAFTSRSRSTRCATASPRTFS